MELSHLTQAPLINKKISDPIWNLAIHSLTAPPRNANDFSLLAQQYRWLCLAEMIRLKWDSKFRFAKLRGELKQSVELEGFFWVKLLNLVSETFLLNPHGQEHPALWFAQILREYEISPTMRSFGSSATTKSEFIALTRKENMLLLELRGNPFEKTATRSLIEKAQREADLKNRWRIEVYTPFVKARQQLTTYCAASGELLTSKGGKITVSRQGRKKEGQRTNKTISEILAL